MESELRDKIRKNPRDPMNYYYLAKDLMKKPLKDVRSIKEIEQLLKRAIEIKPQLWAPKILLGELLYKLGRFLEAEPYFKESLREVPSSESVKEYLTKCLSKKSDPDVSQYSQSKQDSLYIFENNVREFLRSLLEENFGEDWWRRGVPPKIRGSCAARREEALDEEREADLLLFADFHDYRLIIESNKNIFSSYIDTKDWCRKLSEMEPIRNAIAHNRPLTLAPIRVTEYSLSFSKVMEKVKNSSKKNLV
jgi:tetratricopeptide (TPR) repeat protein